MHRLREVAAAWGKMTEAQRARFYHECVIETMRNAIDGTWQPPAPPQRVRASAARGWHADTQGAAPRIVPREWREYDEPAGRPAVTGRALVIVFALIVLALAALPLVAPAIH